MKTLDPNQTLRKALDAVVIGGGITGLAVANRLSRSGKRVHVLEKSSRIGGAVLTESREGFLCEAGPNSMLVKSEAVWEYIRELGLEERRVDANTAANKRYLVKRGRMVALPHSPGSAILTPLYNPLEKLRVLAEPFIGRSRQEDESVTSFVSRRLGPAFLEYGISALVSGIYAGDPDRISIRHAFPKVWNLDQKYGSLIRGAIRLKRERKRQGIVPFKSRMISFREGLQELVTALADENLMTVSIGQTIESIGPEAGEWLVKSSDHEYRAPRLIVATPLPALPGLPFASGLKERIQAVPQLDHPPLSTLVLGFDRDQVGHPLDGFGVLCPRLEKRFTLGCIFSSTLFPGRAPEGKVSLMCFIGGVQQPGNGTLPTDQLIAETVKDLTPLLHLKGDPCFTYHSLWPQAIPQYNIGHARLLESLESLEKDFPGLSIRGNFRGGPGLNDCLESALKITSS